MDTIQNAVEAFWAAFTAAFPEVKSGDSQLSGEDQAAISLWAAGSAGDNPTGVINLPVDWVAEERVSEALTKCMAAAADVLFSAPAPPAPQLTVDLLGSCITHVLHFNPPVGFMNLDSFTPPEVKHPFTDYTLAEAVKLAVGHAEAFFHKRPETLVEVRAYIQGMTDRVNHNWLTGAAALDVLDAAIDGVELSGKTCRFQ